MKKVESEAAINARLRWIADELRRQRNATVAPEGPRALRSTADDRGRPARKARTKK